MKKVYEEKTTGIECACCGKRIDDEMAWIIDVTLLGSNEPKQWKVCKDCCTKRAIAEAISREIYAYWSLPPAEG